MSSDIPPVVTTGFRPPENFPRVPTTGELDDLLARLVRQVEPGRVTTPGTLAAVLGDRSAARFVGERLAHLGRRTDGADRADTPLHRVILSTGSVRTSATLLRSEGVTVRGDKVSDMVAVLQTDFEAGGEPPLGVLLDYQLKSAASVSLEGPASAVRRVAGVDVSYDRDADGAVACCTVMDAGGEVVLEQVAVMAGAAFPYISGYLGFREVPPMAAAISALEEPPDVVLVDGHGVLHPRRFGVACQVGVTLDIPAMGCAKRMLVGNVGPPCQEGEDEVAGPDGDVNGVGPGRRTCPIRLDGEHLGWSLTPVRGTRPAIISPGHQVSVSAGVTIVRPLIKHQMPEPVRRSHIASRRVIAEGRGE